MKRKIEPPSTPSAPSRSAKLLGAVRGSDELALRAKSERPARSASSVFSTTHASTTNHEQLGALGVLGGSIFFGVAARSTHEGYT